jgi:hypothetical protein
MDSRADSSRLSSKQKQFLAVMREREAGAIMFDQLHGFQPQPYRLRDPAE